MHLVQSAHRLLEILEGRLAHDQVEGTYYWRERRQEFNWILHFVFPVGTSLILIYSLYASFNPFPAPPYNLSPFIVGAWLLIGIAILIALRLRGNEEWLQKAGDIVAEGRETPEELVHRTAI